MPVTLRLPLDPAQLANTTFVAQLTKDIAAVMANALAVPETWVKVLRLRAGSIVADIVVAVPSGSASSVLQQALVTLRVSPDTMLAALKQQYNITQPLTVETAGLPEGSYTPGPEVSIMGGLSDRDKRVLAGVLVGVGGIFILSAILVAWLWRRRRAADDGAAEGEAGEPSGSGGSVSAEVQGAAPRGGAKYAVAAAVAGAAATAGAAGAVRDQPQLATEASGSSQGGKGGKGRTRAAKAGKGSAGGEGGAAWNELELVTDGTSEGEHDPRAPAGLRK